MNGAAGSPGESDVNLDADAMNSQVMICFPLLIFSDF